jgi:hypothetical protein
MLGTASRWPGDNHRHEPLEAVFEIMIAEGSDGEMLAQRQADTLARGHEMACLTTGITCPEPAKHPTMYKRLASTKKAAE